MILNRAHALMELGRLERVYKRPAHAPDDSQAFAGDYVAICGTLTAEQFTGAVDIYLRSTGRFFPRPGELLALGREVARQPGAATDLDGRFAEWERSETWPWTPCPVCGEQARPHVVRIDADGAVTERVLMLHHNVLHAKAGIGYTGGALEGTGGRLEHHPVDRRPKTVAP